MYKLLKFDGALLDEKQREYFHQNNTDRIVIQILHTRHIFIFIRP